MRPQPLGGEEGGRGGSGRVPRAPPTLPREPRTPALAGQAGGGRLSGDRTPDGRKSAKRRLGDPDNVLRLPGRPRALVTLGGERNWRRPGGNAQIPYITWRPSRARSRLRLRGPQWPAGDSAAPASAGMARAAAGARSQAVTTPRPPRPVRLRGPAPLPRPGLLTCSPASSPKTASAVLPPARSAQQCSSSQGRLPSRWGFGPRTLDLLLFWTFGS